MLTNDQLPQYNGEYSNLPHGMYLGLFHGSKGLERPDMEEWGFEGPVIGPLKYAQTTYCSEVKYAFTHEHCERCKDYGIDEEGSLQIIGDCIEFRGNLYGDWTVFNIPIPD